MKYYIINNVYVPWILLIFVRQRSLFNLYNKRRIEIYGSGCVLKIKFLLYGASTVNGWPGTQNYRITIL